MLQTLVQSIGLDEAIGLRVGQGFVDKVELDTFAFVVAINCLQTGDFLQEGRSGQAAKGQNGVAPFEITGFDLFAIGRINC